MYVYGERSAMLPGFEYGLNGNSSFINGMGLAVQGALGRKLDSFYRELGGLSAEQGRFCDEAEAALKHAEALKQFIAAGGDNQGWRGSMTGITEPGEENKPLIIKEEVSEQTGWIDYSDSEGGINNHIRYAGEIRKDEVTYSLNSIVDSVNSIYSIYNSLGKIMPVEAASGWSGGIGEFLNNADTVYGTGGDYTRNESGVFSFESAMRDISAGFEARASDFSATENTLGREINSREAALWGSYDTLVSKRKSYDLFGGGDQKTQLEELGKLRIEHEAAKRRVEEFSQR
jgi:hypothetical protein